MKITAEHNERMAKMTFATVYPLYIKKVESKVRTKKELHEVIKWLTSFDDKKLQEQIDKKATFGTFFKESQIKYKCTPDYRSNLWLQDRRNRK